MTNTLRLRDYNDCVRIFDTKKRKIDNNTYLEREVHPEFPDIPSLNTYFLRLHKTRIITYYPDRTTLNSGGWRTSTTKDRMNEYGPAFVSQHKGLWTVRYAGQEYPYADGITLHSDGHVTGAGEDPMAESKLRKQVRQYANDYIDAFHRHEVPEPSEGDCWGCAFGEDIFGHDHLRMHVEEKYYVPSLLNNVLKEESVSSAARDYVACIWSNLSPGWGPNIAVAQLKKALFDYMARRLGLTPGRTMYA